MANNGDGDCNVPFSVPVDAGNSTVTAADGGAGPSTTTTVVDQLAANVTLYGVTPSQGTCTSIGSPAKVTCDLGTIDPGSNATVAMVVSVSQAGSVTNTATATNDQRSDVSASATIQVSAPSSPPVSAPTATTGATTAVTRNSATLSGQIAPGSQTTGYFFQIGRTTAYGLVTPVQRTGTSSITVSATISGLQAHTTYHYRLVAINTSGTSYGQDQTFRTASRAKPGLSLTAESNAKKLPYRYTFSGRLKLPSGVTKAQGCLGTVKITIKNGSKKIVTHRVTVNKRCAYISSFRLIRNLGTNTSGVLSVSARYLGNSTLAEAAAKTATVGYG